MPARCGWTRCQPGPGSSGGSTFVYSSGPTRTAARRQPRPTRHAPVPTCADAPLDLQRLHANRMRSRRSRSTMDRADRQERAGAAAGLVPVLDEPAALAGDGGQPGLGVDGDGEADRLQQRQVAGRVGVGHRVLDAQAFGGAVVGRGSAPASRRSAGRASISPEYVPSARTLISAATISSNSGRRPSTAKSRAPVMRIVRCPSARCSRTRRIPAGKLFVRISSLSSSCASTRDLLDRCVLVAAVEVAQEVAAVDAVELQQPGRLGQRAQDVADALVAIEAARGQPRVAGRPRCWRSACSPGRRRRRCGPARAPACAAGPCGRCVRLRRGRLDPGVLHDRRQVDRADVRRPVDGPRIEGEGLPVGGVELAPTSPSTCRPGRSPRTRCTARTARRTRAPARPRCAWSPARPTKSACFRAAAVTGAAARRGDHGLGPLQLVLHPAAAGKRNSGTTIGWPSAS